MLRTQNLALEERNHELSSLIYPGFSKIGHKPEINMFSISASSPAEVSTTMTTESEEVTSTEIQPVIVDTDTSGIGLVTTLGL